MAYNIVERYKQYKQCEDLLKRAEEVLPTSQTFSHFEDKVIKAYNSYFPEDEIETLTSAVEIFETLSLSQSSPIYDNELSQISSSQEFSEFVEVAEDIDSPYDIQTYFTPNSDMSQAIAEETQDTTISMFEATDNTISFEEIKDNLQETNKVVLKVSDFGVENSEALLGSDGIIDRSNVTSEKAENERLSRLEKEIDSSSSYSEALANINEFNNYETETYTQDTTFENPNEVEAQISYAYEDITRKLKYSNQEDQSNTVLSNEEAMCLEA